MVGPALRENTTRNVPRASPGRAQRLHDQVDDAGGHARRRLRPPDLEARAVLRRVCTIMSSTTRNVPRASPGRAQGLHDQVVRKLKGPPILPRLPHITSPVPRPTAARQAACPARQLPADPAAVSEPSPRQSPAHLGQRPLADGSQAPPAPAPRRRTARSALPSRAGSPAHPRQSPPRCLVHGSVPQAGSCHRSAPRPRCCLGR